MPSGTVKWFNPAKRFGFLERGDGEKDVFVHMTAVEEAGLSSLMEGRMSTLSSPPTIKARHLPST